MGGSRGLSEAGIPSNPPLNCLWDALNSLTPTQSHPGATINYAILVFSTSLCIYIDQQASRDEVPGCQEAVKVISTYRLG